MVTKFDCGCVIETLACDEVFRRLLPRAAKTAERTGYRSRYRVRACIASASESRANGDY